MTRNNLGDHLAWLLRNIDLSTPIGPVLPNATEPLDSPDSLFPISSQNVGAATNSSITPFLDPDPSPADLEVALIVDAATGSGPGLEDTTAHSAGSGNMAKLTSSTKSKKPGLVITQKPAASPSIGRLQKAYSASLHSEELLARSGDKKTTPASSSKARKRQDRRAILDISESDEEDLEALDLTGDDNATSSFGNLGESDFMDKEDFDSRIEPLPRRGKKRKSDEITKKMSEADDEDDEFPDIFDIVPEQRTPASVRRPALSAPRSGSVKARSKISAKAIVEQRMVTQTISTTETRIRTGNDGSDYPSDVRPSSQSSSTKVPSQRNSTPCRPKTNHRCSSPPSERKTATGETKSNSPIKEVDQSRKPRRSDIIQDSDDEFVTPPTHHVSFATCASESESHAESHTSTIGIGQSSSAESPLAVDTPSKQRLMTSNSISLDTRSSQMRDHDAMEVDHIEEVLAQAQSKEDALSEPESDQLTKLVDSFLANPYIVETRRKLVRDQIHENAKKYVKAIETGMSPAAREQIKSEKPPLVAQLKAYDALVEIHKALEDLAEQQKQLLDRIVSAYGEDLDTEEDEALVDQLRENISLNRAKLGRELVGAGLDDASIFQRVQDVTERPQQPPHVVLATQAPEPNFSSSAKRAVAIPECASQVILQTQIPASQLRQNTARQSLPVPAAVSNPAPHSNTEFSSRLQHEEDGDFFMDDEDFLPEVRVHNPPAGQYGSSSVRGSFSMMHGNASKSTSRAAEPFSDYDDDMDFHNMLALAEDFDRRQASSETTQSKTPASVFSETSGNAGITPRALAASKKDAVSASKASIPKELMRFPWSTDVRRALKDRFRMTGFRHNQLEAINATLEGKDAFVLMPTGGGKSLCYQLPAVINSGKTRGVTVVISPLISLMQDQVDHLNALNIIAKPFNGEMGKPARDMILGAFKERNPEHFVQLLYVTPEMVNKSHTFCNGLLSLYRNKKLARIVIDEAHCVSQWGHDFRPDYKALGEFRQKFPTVPVMALTATATQNVIVDIKHNLAMDGCQVFSQSFNRPNLYYEIRDKSKNTVANIADLINTNYPGQTGIVYTLSRKSAENIAKKLSETYNINAHHYHASIEPAEKSLIQRKWQKGEIKVVVATIAFGMGIDKADVRFVIHHHLPKSLEGYYQETGRAGRDGKPSDCFLYFSYGDIATLRKFIDDGEGNARQKERQREMLDKVINFCASKVDCRRVEILRYFGEAFTREECNKTCDNCKAGSTAQLQDFSQCAKAALEVIRLYGRMTLAQCTDILMGKKRPEYEDAEEYYGIAKSMKKSDVNAVIFKLAAENALIEENTVNKKFNMAIQYFVLGHGAREFTSGRRKLQIMAQVGGAKTVAPKQTKKRTKKAQLEAADVLEAPKVRRPPPSTNVSSPIRKRKKARVSHFIDDEATDDDEDDDSAEEVHGPLHENGYEKDNFVVSDGEDDDEDEHFNPARYVPRQRQRQRTLDELGPPISRDTILAEANILDIHENLIDVFMPKAKELEENIRNAKGLRRNLFTEQHLRQMIIQWTTTVEKMRQIPGINIESVDRYGVRFIPLIKGYQAQYKEIMGDEDDDEDLEPATRSASARQIPGPVRPEVVELLSSDDDGFDEEGEEGEQEGLQSSKYFGQGASSGGHPSREIEKWHETFAQLSQQSASKKAKRPFTRKASGSRGSFARGRSNAGVSKRKASGASRRTSGGTTKSKAPRGGGSKGASSGIGLMPV